MKLQWVLLPLKVKSKPPVLSERTEKECWLRSATTFIVLFAIMATVRPRRINTTLIHVGDCMVLLISDMNMYNLTKKDVECATADKKLESRVKSFIKVNFT